MKTNKEHYFVYIFGGQPGSDLQIGVVDDLQKQIANNKLTEVQTQSPVPGSKLVYYEHYDVESIALNRERQIKSGDKDSTNSLIESMNPNWLDLSDTLQ